MKMMERFESHRGHSPKHSESPQFSPLSDASNNLNSHLVEEAVENALPRPFPSPPHQRRPSVLKRSLFPYNNGIKKKLSFSKEYSKCTAVEILFMQQEVGIIPTNVLAVTLLHQMQMERAMAPTLSNDSNGEVRAANTGVSDTHETPPEAAPGVNQSPHGRIHRRRKSITDGNVLKAPVLSDDAVINTPTEQEKLHSLLVQEPSDSEENSGNGGESERCSCESDNCDCHNYSHHETNGKINHESDVMNDEISHKGNEINGTDGDCNEQFMNVRADKSSATSLGNEIDLVLELAKADLNAEKPSPIVCRKRITVGWFLQKNRILLAANDLIHPDRAGFLLTKLNRQGRWKQRWCVLNRGWLFIMDDEYSNSAHYAIELKYCLLDLYDVLQRAFCVHQLGDYQLYAFMAESREEKVKWMEALLKNIYRSWKLNHNLAPSTRPSKRRASVHNDHNLVLSSFNPFTTPPPTTTTSSLQHFSPSFPSSGLGDLATSNGPCTTEELHATDLSSGAASQPPRRRHSIDSSAPYDLKKFEETFGLSLKGIDECQSADTRSLRCDSVNVASTPLVHQIMIATPSSLLHDDSRGDDAHSPPPH